MVTFLHLNIDGIVHPTAICCICMVTFLHLNIDGTVHPTAICCVNCIYCANQFAAWRHICCMVTFLHLNIGVESPPTLLPIPCMDKFAVGVKLDVWGQIFSVVTFLHLNIDRAVPATICCTHYIRCLVVSRHSVTESRPRATSV